jgi:hypothetical protein
MRWRAKSRTSPGAWLANSGEGSFHEWVTGSSRERLTEPYTFLAIGKPPAKPFYRGDRFEVVKDSQAAALTHWRAPLTTGFETKLPAGLVVVAVKDAHDDYGVAVIPD